MILGHMKTIQKTFWKQQNSAWEADFATFACMKLWRSVFSLILRPIQNLKALSVLTCKVYNWSWKEFRSILKTSRAIFSISLLLFEKINFLHQQKRFFVKQISTFLEQMKQFAKLFASVDAKNWFFQKVKAILKKWLEKFLIWT